MLNVILFGLGVISAAVWSLLFLANYGKFKGMIAAVNDDNYFFKDIFVVGMGVIQMFHIDCVKLGQKNRPLMAELYTKQYADFNVLVTISAQISYVMMFIPIGCFMGVASGEPIIALALWAMGIFLAVYTDMKARNLVEERHDSMLMALPNVLSKMALLVSVGTTFREAWKVSAESASGVLGEEMRETSKLIDNGMPEKEAYADFAERCKIQQIKKLVSVIIQNLEKGSSELARALTEIATETWTEKKNIVKRLGENANTKLIIPMMIMFAGILVMILVPIMTNLNMNM